MISYGTLFIIPKVQLQKLFLNAKNSNTRNIKKWNVIIYFYYTFRGEPDYMVKEALLNCLPLQVAIRKFRMTIDKALAIDLSDV